MSVSETAFGAHSAVRRLKNDPSGVHSVLLYGPEGAGMEDYADELAQGWMCKLGGPEGACGQCAVCNAFKTGRLIDLMRVRPWGPQNLIKIGAMRSPKPEDPDAPKPPLLDFLRTPPMMARCKVAIFEDAHRMNSDASNALLKTLEEPPPYAKIILTTTEFNRIIPTVRSRCLSVSCSYQVSPGQDEVLRLWGASPGLALKIETFRPHYESLLEVFNSSLQAPPGAAIALAERCRECAEPLAKALKLSTRAAQVEILRCLAGWLVAKRPEKPALAQSAVEAHRLIQGNINAGALLDHLWVEILSR